MIMPRKMRGIVINGFAESSDALNALLQMSAEEKEIFNNWFVTTAKKLRRKPDRLKIDLVAVQAIVVDFDSGSRQDGSRWGRLHVIQINTDEPECHTSLFRRRILEVWVDPQTIGNVKALKTSLVEILGVKHYNWTFDKVQLTAYSVKQIESKSASVSLIPPLSELLDELINLQRKKPKMFDPSLYYASLLGKTHEP
jgi:hypothetical protein